ncbi:MAG: ComEC/Rec2 family competence protein [Alphaproteobacteria bacterium]|nr:ComEC/Rec2 family competence protein [Alphaproteobacteria bacterium]
MNPVSFPLTSFLNERDRWFLWLPVLIVVGIAVYFALPFQPALSLLALTPGMTVLTILSRRKPWAFPIMVSCLAIGLGFNAAQVETAREESPMLSAPLDPISMTGTLMRAEALPEGARLTLKRPSIKTLPRKERPLTIRVKVKTPYAELPKAGTRVNLWGPLWPPNDSAVPGGYDFRRQSFFKQLGATGLSYVQPRTYESRYPLAFFWDGAAILFETTRHALTLAAFERLDGPAKTMTAALLSGSQTGIDRKVMEAMRASGLSHLLSISGVHVSMMALLVYFPLRFLLALFPWIALRLPIKKIAAFTAILATALYTCLVGADAPTVRSALMTGLVFFAIMTDRRAQSLRLLALAASIIMLATPSAAMGASFQMSFAAVLAMIAAYEKRLDTALITGIEWCGPSWMKTLTFHLRDIVLTSLIATAATTPFTIFHFQNFSFYGVVANMIAIPLTTFWIMPCLLLTYIFLPFGGASLFIDGTGWGVKGLISLAQTVATWPYAQIPFPPIPFWAFGLIIGGGLWLCLWRRAWRYAGLLAIMAGCFYPLFVTLPTVYISDDKPIWAVRLRDGRMAVYGKRKEDFTVGQWLQQVGQPKALYLNDKTITTLPDELTCDAAYCAYSPPTRTGSPTIIFLHKDAAPDIVTKACANRELIVVSFARLTACSAPQAVIDADSVWQRGAHSLSFTPEGPFTINTVRTERGQRPWSPGFGSKPTELGQ